MFMDCITYTLSSFSKWNYSTKKVEEIFQCDSDLNISLLLFFFFSCVCASLQFNLQNTYKNAMKDASQQYLPPPWICTSLLD